MISILKRAGIGFLLGIAVGNFIAWISAASEGTLVSPDLLAAAGSQTGAVAIQTLTMGFYGAIAMGGMCLYEIDRWPLALATAVHYFLIAVGFILMDLILQWHSSPAAILVIEGIMLAVFALIWLIMFMRYRSEVRDLNEELQEMQAGPPTEE